MKPRTITGSSWWTASPCGCPISCFRRTPPQAASRRPASDLLAALATTAVPTILISNEVGWGIVPDNPLAREFRDQAGWLHQRLAQVADLVVLVVAGVPVLIKSDLFPARP